MPGSTPQRQAALYLRRRITRRWARTSISATSASSVQPKASSARPHFGQLFGLPPDPLPLPGLPTRPEWSDRALLAFLLPSGSPALPWGWNCQRAHPWTVHSCAPRADSPALELEPADSSSLTSTAFLSPPPRHAGPSSTLPPSAAGCTLPWPPNPLRRAISRQSTRFRLGGSTQLHAPCIHTRSFCVQQSLTAGLFGRRLLQDGVYRIFTKLFWNTYSANPGTPPLCPRSNLDRKVFQENTPRFGRCFRAH